MSDQPVIFFAASLGTFFAPPLLHAEVQKLSALLDMQHHVSILGIFSLSALCTYTQNAPRTAIAFQLRHELSRVDV